MHFRQWKRREFITLLGGAATAWPLAAHALQSERIWRIGVLMASAADDLENQARMAAFLQGLAQLGWTDGRNVRIDTRWAMTNADDLRGHAADWPRSRRTSSSLRLAPQPRRRCFRPPAPCRACSCRSSTRSAGIGRRLRDRPVRRRPGGGAVLGGGVEPGRRARCVRNRARRHGIRALRTSTRCSASREFFLGP